MAQATPWQLAGARTHSRSGRVRRTTVYRRDPYWFSWASQTHGPDQLPVMIPAAGPGSAGSTFPNNQPQVERVDITAEGAATDYGSNMGRPAGVGANLPGGI